MVELWLAKNWWKIAAAAALVVITAYSVNRWNAGTIERLKAEKITIQNALTIAQSSNKNLQSGIDERNRRIAKDAADYAAKLRDAKQAEAAAYARATQAERTATALKLARPKPGQDVVLQGIDLVLGSVQ